MKTTQHSSFQRHVKSKELERGGSLIFVERRAGFDRGVSVDAWFDR
jgi:hypothetical protein